MPEKKIMVARVETGLHVYVFDKKGFCVRKTKDGKEDPPFPGFSSRKVTRVVTCEKGKELVIEMRLPKFGKNTYTTKKDLVTGIVEENL